MSNTLSTRSIAVENFFNVIAYVLVSIPMLLHLATVQQYALNIPRWDDYDAILGFLNEFKHASMFDKFILLFKQHNEHRILSSKLVYSIYYSLTGTINFRHIIFIGNLQLVGIYIIIGSFLKKLIPQHWLSALFVLGLCLFDLNSYENSDFAMAAMQNYGILFLFMSSIYFYSSSRKYMLPIAMFVQAVAIFSSGNGIVAAFFIIAYTFLGRLSKDKIICSAIIMLLFSPMYYVAYQKATVSFFSADPARFVPYFLHVVGAHFSYTLGIILSIVILGLLIWAAPIKRNIKEIVAIEMAPILVLGLFVLASIGVLSLFRAQLSIETSYSSRYYIYSHLLVFVLYVFVLFKFKEKRANTKILGYSLMLLSFVYIKNYTVGKDGFNGFYNTLRGSEYDYPDKNRAKMITDEACRLNIYCLDKAKQAI